MDEAAIFLAVSTSTLYGWVSVPLSIIAYGW